MATESRGSPRSSGFLPANGQFTPIRPFGEPGPAGQRHRRSSPRKRNVVHPSTLQLNGRLLDTQNHQRFLAKLEASGAYHNLLQGCDTHQRTSPSPERDNTAVINLTKDQLKLLIDCVQRMQYSNALDISKDNDNVTVDEGAEIMDLDGIEGFAPKSPKQKMMKHLDGHVGDIDSVTTAYIIDTFSNEDAESWAELMQKDDSRWSQVSEAKYFGEDGRLVRHVKSDYG